MSNEKNNKNDELETEVQNKKQVKKPLKLADDATIKCMSTCSNLLFKPTFGGRIKWKKRRDTQDLTIRELKDMKANQQRFFDDQWIVLLGTADLEECTATSEEVYKALGLSRYFDTLVDVSDIQEVMSWDVNQIKEKVKIMPNGVKDNLLLTLNANIRNGTIDSLKKIRAFEAALGCKLVSIE